MFWIRLLSGVVLLSVTFVSFWAGAPLLQVVLYLVALTGYLELTRVMGIRGDGRECAGTPETAGIRADGRERAGASETADIRGDGSRISAPEMVGIVAVTAYYGLLLLRDMGFLAAERIDFMLPCIVFFFLGELLVYILAFPRFRAESVAAVVFAFLYVPVMLSFLDLIRMQERGMHLVWLVFISAWGSDTCAYCVGVLVGKKRIFPQLSPKKTLEGCVGGVVGAALIGAGYAACLGAREPRFLSLIALICGLGGLAGMAGDLAASAVKRNKNIKDYGKLIPGHGGIMDRFDSVIVTAPLTYFLIVLLLGPV